MVSPVARRQLDEIDKNLRSKIITAIRQLEKDPKTSRAKTDIKKLPLKIIDIKQQKPFIKLVDQILEKKKDNPDADTVELEREIDEMAYELYGLTKEEIGIVEGKI